MAPVCSAVLTVVVSCRQLPDWLAASGVQHCVATDEVLEHQEQQVGTCSGRMECCCFGQRGSL